MKKKKILGYMLCGMGLVYMSGMAYATEDTGVTPTQAETQESETSQNSSQTSGQGDSKGGSVAAPTSVAVRKANQEVDNAKEEKETMKQGLDAAKQMLSDLKTMEETVSSHVQQLDVELGGVNQQLVDLQTQLQDKIAQVEKIEAEVGKARRTEEKQYNDMKVRIKYMYEEGNDQLLTMFLASESMADFLNKADYVVSVSKYDRDMLNEFERIRKEVEDLEAKLVKEQEELEAQQETTKKKIAAIEMLVEAKELELDTVKGQIDNKEQQIKEYEEAIAEQDRVIKELEETVRLAEAAANKGDSDGSKTVTKRQSYDGGMFTWPCPGYTRISDEYGMRMHPTLMVEKFHNGLDLAAPAGTDILAAYDGTVVAADYNESMGNFVMIAHGDSLYTIYMHASALYVSTGDSVSKGQCIAAVGTTGRSTGNHLHFGVRRNGEYVDPMEYLQ